MEITMNKKIILSLAAGLALSLTVIGCGNSAKGGSDMANGGGGGSPDMGFACVQNPTAGTDFLNGCPPAGVDKVEITPQFPSLAPNGTLPTLP
jgi:hypothetical protein